MSARARSIHAVAARQKAAPATPDLPRRSRTSRFNGFFGTGMPLHDRHTAINSRNFRVAHGAQVAHQMVALEDEAEMLAAQPPARRAPSGRFHAAGHLVTAACGPIEAARMFISGCLNQADPWCPISPARMSRSTSLSTATTPSPAGYSRTTPRGWRITTGRSCRCHLSVSVRTSVRQAYGCCSLGAGSVADHDPLALLQAFEHLRLHAVVQADAHLALFDGFLPFSPLATRTM